MQEEQTPSCSRQKTQGIKQTGRRKAICNQKLYEAQKELGKEANKCDEANHQKEKSENKQEALERQFEKPAPKIPGRKLECEPSGLSFQGTCQCNT